MKYPEEYSETTEKNFNKIFFVDLETTGLDAMRNEILTASISVCDYHTLDQIEEIELTFKPQNLKFWSQEAEAVHGISLQKALTFQDKIHSTNELIRFFKRNSSPFPQPLVSHALNLKGYFFDQNFLLQHFMRSSQELFFEFRKMAGVSQSTINYAKAIGGFPNYKLSTLCAHFGIPLDHHNAKSDREACQKLYSIFRSGGIFSKNEKIENSFTSDSGKDKKYPSAIVGLIDQGTEKLQSLPEARLKPIASTILGYLC